MTAPEDAAPLTGPDAAHQLPASTVDAAPMDAAPMATAASGTTAPTATAAPTGTRSRGRPLRGALAVVAALAALLGSWTLLRAGVRVDTWPSLLTDEGSTSITRYSGPWITAAAAAALAAGMLLLMGAVDLVRYRRSARLSV